MYSSIAKNLNISTILQKLCIMNSLIRENTDRICSFATMRMNLAVYANVILNTNRSTEKSTPSLINTTCQIRIIGLTKVSHQVYTNEISRDMTKPTK